MPEGFERVQATVTKADGTLCELCLWLASTPQQRELGLMRVTDLGGPDGMAFLYPEPTSGAFWMKNTVLPLSIGFYGLRRGVPRRVRHGAVHRRPVRHVSHPDDFTVAIETAQGGLAELGIDPAARSTSPVRDQPGSPTSPAPDPGDGTELATQVDVALSQAS